MHGCTYSKERIWFKLRTIRFVYPQGLNLYRPTFEPNIDVLQAGSRSFKISGPDNDHIFVTSKESIKEINRAKKDELSLFGATKQVITSRRSSSNGDV
jgi:hypothetical protein